MASGPPILRKIAWISMLPQAGVMVALIACAQWLQVSPYWGIIAYLILSIGLRSLITRHHRRGMSLIKRGQYAEAIPLFQQSNGFFLQYNWLDRWRYMLLLSSSRTSYREMALVNMAFCYTQIGEGKQAKALYEQALTEFPQSAIAQTALKMIETIGIMGAEDNV